MSVTTMNVILIVVLIAVMYFVMIRPQQKQDKQNKEMRAGLKIGDEIVTIGGIVGKITKITEKTVTIQTGNPNTKIELLKASVANVAKKSELADDKKADKNENDIKTEEEETSSVSRNKKVTPKKLTKKSE